MTFYDDITMGKQQAQKMMGTGHWDCRCHSIAAIQRETKDHSISPRVKQQQRNHLKTQNPWRRDTLTYADMCMDVREIFRDTPYQFKVFDLTMGRGGDYSFPKCVLQLKTIQINTVRELCRKQQQQHQQQRVKHTENHK